MVPMYEKQCLKKLNSSRVPVTPLSHNFIQIKDEYDRQITKVPKSELRDLFERFPY